MTILIITGMDDVHADAVIPLLEQHERVAVVRLNTDNFSENASYSVSSGQWDGHLYLRDSGRSFRLSSVASVWLRKPVPIQTRQTFAFPQAVEFANTENEAFLRSLYGLLDHAFWVSDPWKVRMASQKLPNLRAAARIGLRTPRTLVTNDESEARRFAMDCNWQILAKPFALTTFKTPDSQRTSWDSFSSAVDRDTFEVLGQSIGLAPTMLQEYVEKEIELRVTIVGRHVFAVSIDSQRHPFAQHDWRAVDVEELLHSEYSLPRELKERLLAFNRLFGLQFSTHDLIVNKQGEFVWLECNPNGQWAWVEQLAGVPISNAIAEILTAPSSHAL